MLWLWILLALLVVVLAVLIGGALFFFDFTVRRYPHAKFPQGDDASMTLWENAVREGGKVLDALPFEAWDCTSHDGLALRARFYPAAAPSARTMVCVHGYRSTGVRDYAPLAGSYHARGWNLLLVDDRAHGESEGNYIGFGWLDHDDVLTWLAQLHRRRPQDAALVQGISMGSAAVMLAAGDARFPAFVRGVVADCGYESAWAEFQWEMRQMFHLPPFPLLNVTDLVCRARAKYSFRQADAAAAMRRCHTPVLFIHGEADTFVPTRMVHTVYDACAAPKTLLLVPGAGHAQSCIVDKPAYLAAVDRFAQSVGFADAPVSETAAEVPAPAAASAK